MTDSIKFIFRTLIKVPIIIFVCFTIFNVFAFGFSYFKMLGVSYVALQTAVENNYIPENEKNTLEAYMNNTLETGVLQNVGFTNDSATSASDRRQYGKEVTVGVQAHYRFIWPLMPHETMINNSGVDGLNNPGRYQGAKSDQELEDARNAKDSARNNIVIEYKVPGLKYYADMED